VKDRSIINFKTIAMKKSLFAFFALIVISLHLQAQYVTIPDANFRSWLSTNGFSGCMNGNQLDTTCPAVVHATNINCYGSQISDLTGIQYFDNLEFLLCANNQLASLPPLPAGLRQLSCGTNQLAGLPVLPNTLTHLECESNLLATFPSLPGGVIWLNVSSNQLTSIPVLPTSLSTFFCNNNLLRLDLFALRRQPTEQPSGVAHRLILFALRE
jgi:hypothetical protein